MAKPAKKKGILHDFYAPLADIGLKEAADETRRAFAPVSSTEEIQPDNTPCAPMPQNGPEGHRDIGADTVSREGAEGQTFTGAEGHWGLGAEGMPQNVTEGHRDRGAEGMPQVGTEGHRGIGAVVNTSAKPNRGLPFAQGEVLKILVSLVGNTSKVITYNMVIERHKNTVKSVRKAMDALEGKGFIHAPVAMAPGGRSPIGRLVTIMPDALLALHLFDPQNQAEWYRGRGAEGVPQIRAEGHRGIGAQGLPQGWTEGQTICSSSILTTTTAETTSGEAEDKFAQLILDDWTHWGLRPAAVQSFMAKPIALLQDLLDRTAYAIRQREGTDRPIQNKIGFLKTNLQNEFCDVDASFVTREERIRKQRTEQLKREAERIKAVREEEREAAIELLMLQLSGEELAMIRKQAIGMIREEMQQPNLNPGQALITSYERTIFADLAKERGLFS